MQKRRRPKSIAEVIQDCGDKKFDELSTKGQILFEFVKLIVDIQYRNRYGARFGDTANRGYNSNAQSEVLADQVTPVDDGLLGISQRELLDL